MSEFLFHYYPVHPTTWAYLSSLLMIGLFFKFGRFWSVRNLDLTILIMLAPGLLLVHFGEMREQRDALGDAGLLELDKSQSRSESSVVDVGSSQVAIGAVRNDASVPSTNQELAGSLIPASAISIEASPKTGNPETGNLETGNPETDNLETGNLETGNLETGNLETGNLETGDSETGDSDSVLAATDSNPTAEQSGTRVKYLGFLFLLGTSGLLLLRLLIDPKMVRRPLLEPNLSAGGLTFMGCASFVFLMANVISSPVTKSDLQGPRDAEQLLARVVDDDREKSEWHGPGNAVLHLLPSLVTMPHNWSADIEKPAERYVRTAKTMAILSHLAIVIGLVLIGYQHFGNIQTGIGAATLYLMLPYTAQMTGRVDHILPAALLVWAILCYRRPLPAGVFIGLAIGVVYYPLFLLPLWISFYWERGLMRFLIGVLAMLVGVAASMAFVSIDFADFLANLQQMFGIWFPEMNRLAGVWELGWEPIYRLPVLVAFIVLSFAFALWPVQKNLGTLLSCSAAVMVATQFWHGDGGGLYMAWYLPLTLLTIYRPNLEDRVALTVLGEGWFPRRRQLAVKGIDIAA